MNIKAIRSTGAEKLSCNSKLLSRVSSVTLGVAVSVAFAKVFIPAADADSTPALQIQSGVLSGNNLQTKNTAVAEAVAQGLSIRPAANSDTAETMVLAQATIESSSSGSHGDILLARTNELMAVDNREVDSVAVRLKEIIRARYRAENENIQSLNTIDDLRARLVELKNVLQKTNAKNESLRVEQAALEEKISQVIFERDEAINNVDTINSEIKGHIGSVQALQAESQSVNDMLNSKEQTLAELTEQLNSLTLEREDARAEVVDLEARLAQNENDFNNLTLQLESITEERDAAIESSIALQNDLGVRDDSVSELNTLLDEAAQNRVTAESTIAELELLLEDKENTITTTQSELSEKDNLLEGLKMQILHLSEEKSSSIDQVAEANSLLNLKTDNIAELELKLASLATEKQEAMAYAESNLEKITSQLQIAIVERDESIALADTLQNALSAREANLLELNTQLDAAALSREKSESTIAELQLSVGNTESAVMAAQEELFGKNNQLNDLQAQIEQLMNEKDSSISKAAEINSLLSLKVENISDLEYKLASLTTEKDKALEQINLLQDRLNNAESAAGEVLSDKNSLTEKLALFETQATDVSNTLVAEQQAHIQSKAALTALQSETDRLKAEIEALHGERDALLSETSKLRSTSAELYGSQQATQKELDGRQNDLVQAKSELSDLNESILVVKNERDMANDTVDKLEEEIVVLRNAVEAARNEHEITTRTHAEDFAKQKKAFDDIAATQNGEIEDLNENILLLRSSMEKQEKSSRLSIVERDDSIAQLRKQVAEIKTEREQLDKLYKEGNTRLAKMANEVSGFATSRDLSDQKIVKLKSLNDDLDSQLSAMTQKLDDVVAENNRNTTQYNNDIRKLRGDYNALGSREETALEKIKALEAGNKALREELLLSQASHSSAEEHLEDIKSNLRSYESELSISNQRLDEFLVAQSIAEEKQQQQSANMQSLRLSLTDQLSSANLGNVTLQDTREDNSIPIRLGNADFFAAGSAQLTLEGRRKLSSLAEIIQTYPTQRIVVEGHTDSVPIGIGLKDRFESNWELSVTRAASAVRHLQAFTDFEPGSMTAAGFGEFQPIADNETDAGRKQNRRVEIVLYPVESEYQTVSSAIE